MRNHPAFLNADTAIRLHSNVTATLQMQRLCAVSLFARGVDATVLSITTLLTTPPPITSVNPCGSRMEGTLAGGLSAEFSTQKPRAIAALLSVRAGEPQRLLDAPVGPSAKGLFAFHRPV